jgi:hypothetical protein
MKRLDPILRDPIASFNTTLLNDELENVRKVRRIFVDASAAAVGKTLPNGYETDFDFYYVKTDSSGNAVTITPYTGQTIEGAGSLALAAQYDKALLTFYRGQWYIISP